MTFGLFLLHWRGFASGDMVRALGSAVTGRYENSLGPGLIIHFTFGILFAILYISIWSRLPDIASARVWQYVGLGVFCGFAQGLVTSMLLMVFVAEYHPLRRFRVSGFGVALVHVLGNMVYGGTIGLLAGIFRVSL
jgi:hypothetical protein